jgi:hypothetical protein
MNSAGLVLIWQAPQSSAAVLQAQELGSRGKVEGRRTLLVVIHVFLLHRLRCQATQPFSCADRDGP